jgi:hypothetical protein
MNLFRLVLALACAAVQRGGCGHRRARSTHCNTGRPALDEYCAKCHGPARAKGGINLAGFTNTVSVYREPKVWGKGTRQGQANEMPPENKPQPAKDQRESLIKWVQKTLADLEQARFAADPGRVRIHRLSRTEYNCTIRDLLGVDTHPADTFPTEGGGGGGFDNNADTLFVPPILIRYLAAATVCHGRCRRKSFL